MMYLGIPISDKSNETGIVYLYYGKQPLLPSVFSGTRQRSYFLFFPIFYRLYHNRVLRALGKTFAECSTSGTRQRSPLSNRSLLRLLCRVQMWLYRVSQALSKGPTCSSPRDARRVVCKPSNRFILPA